MGRGLPLNVAVFRQSTEADIKEYDRSTYLLPFFFFSKHL